MLSCQRMMGLTDTLCAIVLIWVVSPSAGFIPIKFLAWSVKGIDLSSDSAVTHKDMSRAAILDVAADLLKENPNPNSAGSSSRIDALNDMSLSEESLITAYYGERRLSITEDFQDVITDITDANAEVDLGSEKKVAAAHFDSEQILAGQDRLVEIRQNIVSQIKMGNYDLARTETGRLFHALQDFYSYSNWIENGNRVPYRVLWGNERPGDIASLSTQSCTDCEEDRTTFSIGLFNIVGKIIRPHICIENIATTSLTTGYAANQRDSKGKLIVKPPGKCSHGGFLDSTSTMSSIGGINKDSPYNVWSPHHNLHEEAARVAQQATFEVLQEIRGDVKSDTAFSMYLGLNVTQRISIAYVIDTTSSMHEELSEIQRNIQTIKADLKQYVESFGGPVRVRYILVPFNNSDLDITFETEDVEQFLARIRELSAVGGDMSEPSIGAIIRAVRASEPGAPIYVFTDAPASDVNRLNEAKSLIMRKNVRIFFALRNLNLRKRSVKSQKRQVNEDVYKELAELSGGQLLRVQNTSEVSDIASLVSFFALENRCTIFYRSGRDSMVEHSFAVDSSNFEVTISINGRGIVVSVLNPQGLNSNNLTQYSTVLVSATSYFAQINVTNDSLYGEWRIRIQSQGFYSIYVWGRSELSVAEEIYAIDSSNAYGYSSIEGRPLQGNPIAFLIGINGVNLTVNEINLINADGVNLTSITNFTTLSEGIYVGIFLPPPEAFMLQLLGVDGNGYKISRVGETLVEVSTILLALYEGYSDIMTMRPGEDRNLTLVMSNQGEGAQFALKVYTDTIGTNRINSVDYTLTPASISLEKNSSAEINIEIVLANDTVDEMAVFFTVVAESMADENIDNFITFTVITTTRPPPQFNMIQQTTENAAVELIAQSMIMELMVTLGYFLLY